MFRKNYLSIIIMSNKINACRLSYILFSVFVACLIVFRIHKGFKQIDIILIPLFSIVLYLIIDYSAEVVFKRNLENFTIELLQNKSSNLATFTPVPTLSHVESFADNDTNSVDDNANENAPDNANENAPDNADDSEDIDNEGNIKNSKPAPLKDSTTKPVQTLSGSKVLPKTGKRTPPPSPRQRPKSPNLKTAEDEYDHKVLKKLMNKNDKGLVGAPFNSQTHGSKKKASEEKGQDKPLTNKNLKTDKPVNINVNYNNNRPYTYNEFGCCGGSNGGKPTFSSQEKNVSLEKKNEEMGKKTIGKDTKVNPLSITNKKPKDGFCGGVANIKGMGSGKGF